MIVISNLCFYLTRLFPVIEADLSDSGTVDNVLELLVMAGGRTLPEVTSYIHWPHPHVYVVDSGLAHLPLSGRRFSPSFLSLLSEGEKRRPELRLLFAG